MPGLSELVKGYTEGQQLHMEKARKIADEQAKKFEQEFKVNDAKQQAQEAASRLTVEKQRAETEKLYAGIAAKKQEADDIHKAAQEKISQARIDMQRDVALGKIDLSDYQAKLKRRAKIFDDLVKEHVPREQAEAAADQLLYDEVSAFEQRMSAQRGSYLPQGQPQQGGSAAYGTVLPAVPNQPVTPSGNPIMDLLHGMHGHNVQPPSERPDVLSHKTPKQELEEQLQQARAEQAHANAEKQKAVTASVQLNTQINNQILQSKKLLTDAQREKVKAETSKVPAQIAELKAHTIALNAQGVAALGNLHVAQDRERRLASEATLKADSKDAKARKDVSTRLKTTRDAATKLNQAVLANVKHAAELDLKYQKAAKETPPDLATMNTVTGMKAAVAAQLEDLRNKYVEANNEYLETVVQGQKFGITSIDTPSGARDPFRNRANDRATDAAAAVSRAWVRDAARQAGVRRPLTTVPIDAPHPAGAHVGELAPKRTLGKKKGKVVYQSGGVTIREK